MELIFQTSGDDDGINQFTMEISGSDSVPQIKQKIQELKGFPIFRQTLRFNGAILANLRHSQIVDGSTIHLHLRQHIDLNTQLPTEVESSSSCQSSTRPAVIVLAAGTVVVVVRYDGNVARFAVRADERVSELRGCCSRFHGHFHRYDFLHNHRMMDDTRSFAFHRVLQGDVIQPAPRFP